MKTALIDPIFDCLMFQTVANGKWWQVGLRLPPLTE
jgi:hypothetical protein